MPIRFTVRHMSGCPFGLIGFAGDPDFDTSGVGVEFHVSLLPGRLAANPVGA